jgi:hypothetical protein
MMGFLLSAFLASYFSVFTYYFSLSTSHFLLRTSYLSLFTFHFSLFYSLLLSLIPHIPRLTPHCTTNTGIASA